MSMCYLFLDIQKTFIKYNHSKLEFIITHHVGGLFVNIC